MHSTFRLSLSSALATLIHRALVKLRPSAANSFSKFWVRQQVLHPRWCGPLEQGQDYYNAIYAASDDYRTSYRDSPYFPTWSLISDRLSSYGLTSVLDIGCGSGQLASMLLDGPVSSYVGIDFSLEAVELAKKNEARAAFFVADAKTSDVFERYDYDVIVCTEVLEHIVDDLQLLERFPVGTRCLCTVPNFPSLSHVRHFETAAEVEDCYRTLLTDLSVDSIPIPSYPKHVLYVLDGVRC